MPLEEDELYDEAANKAIEDALGGGDFDDIDTLKGILPLDDELYDEAANEAIEDALGGGDFDDIDSLKGILSEALGDTPFKVALVVVVTFNFAYTFYNAFGEKHTDESFVLSTQCSCDPSDRRFYSIITVGTAVIWAIFLFIYGGFKTFHSCCKLDDDEGTSRLVDAAAKGLKKHKRYFKKELIKLVASTYYMDDDNLNRKMEILKQKTLTSHYPIYLERIFPTSHINGSKLKIKPKVNAPIKRKCTCIIIIKLILVIIRFVIQISIIPLLICQWLNHYAWSCVMDGLRDYCGRLTEEYHHNIGMDQSITIYGVYVTILLSVLFTIMIKWLPKGFPHMFELAGCIPGGCEQLEPKVEEELQSTDGVNEPIQLENVMDETKL